MKKNQEFGWVEFSFSNVEVSLFWHILNRLVDKWRCRDVFSSVRVSRWGLTLKILLMLWSICSKFVRKRLVQTRFCIHCFLFKMACHVEYCYKLQWGFIGSWSELSIFRAFYHVLPDFVIASHVVCVKIIFGTTMTCGIVSFRLSLFRGYLRVFMLFPTRDENFVFQ